MTANLPFATLVKRSDFLRLNRGQKYVAPCFILRALPQPDSVIASKAKQSMVKEDGLARPEGLGITPISACRVGYTVTTKCGNAVIRNRTKRRFRALIRELLPIHGRAGLDYVLIARADVNPSAAEVEFSELRKQVEKALVYMGGRFLT